MLLFYQNMKEYSVDGHNNIDTLEGLNGVLSTGGKQRKHQNLYNIMDQIGLAKYHNVEG